MTDMDAAAMTYLTQPHPTSPSGPAIRSVRPPAGRRHYNNLKFIRGDEINFMYNSVTSKL